MRVSPAGRLSLLLLTALPLRLSAEAPNLMAALLADTTPVRSLADFARQKQIPLEGIELAPEGGLPRKGDTVTLVLGLRQAGILRQWLVRVEADDLAAAERQAKPRADDVIYTSTGLELHYPNTPTALQIELIGPFGPDDEPSAGRSTPPIRQVRTLVSREYLELGIAEYCRQAQSIAARLKAAGIDDPVFTGGSSPPPPAELAKGRKAAAAFQLTPEEERLAFSVYFGLRTFFGAAMEIPATQDLLEQVIQKPSVWSIARHLGVNTNFTYGWQHAAEIAGGWAGVTLPAYQLPIALALNETPAVRVMLAVATPRPPLQTCAGILAIHAEHPTDKGRVLHLRLVAARRPDHPAAARQD